MQENHELPGRPGDMTPEQRRARAQVAANARWSRPFAREDQAYIARAALFARLEREVDPHGRLAPEKRAVLVRSALRRHIARLNAARARKRATRAYTSRNGADSSAADDRT